jgi:pimeloyl-ACP methyl ester carboxylesterase
MRKLIQFSTGVVTGATAVLALKSYPLFKKNQITAYQRVQRESQIIETTAGPINYGVAGEGPPVLIIHGAGGGFDQALHTAQILGEGFQWIAPSRFGYLDTVLPEDATPAAQADAHAALLDALKIERVPIIGLSAGGPSALQFALRHPDRCSGLVMIAAVSQAMIEVASNPDVMEKIFDRLLFSDWLIWLGLQLAIHKILPPLGVPARVIHQMDAVDAEWLNTLLLYQLPVQPRRPGLVNDFFQIYLLDLLPAEQITVPTLVIHAKDDSLVSIKHGRLTAEHIPDARLVELPSGGHLLIGQRTRVKTEVGAFLSQITRNQ